jgi:hypothetical protein
MTVNNNLLLVTYTEAFRFQSVDLDEFLSSEFRIEKKKKILLERMSLFL